MSNANLISKKEVLAHTRISYSQLYRWKRRGLIPESWFVRRSTFTGQETFFPRDKILSRIDRIKTLKRTHALDELADIILSSQGRSHSITFDNLQRMGWADTLLLDILQITPEAKRAITPDEVLCLGVLRRLKPYANREELALAHDSAREHLARQRLGYSPSNHVLHFIRKKVSGGAVSAEVALIVVASEETQFDTGTRVVASVDLQTIQQGLDLDLAAVSKEEGQSSSASEQSSGDNDTPPGRPT